MRGRWKVERLRQSDKSCLSVRDKGTGGETIEVSASYLYLLSRPHIIGVCGHYYHERSTWGMSEILLEAWSIVCFQLDTELPRGENETTPIWTPHRASPVCGENGNKSHAKPSRQGRPGSGRRNPGCARIC